MTHRHLHLVIKKTPTLGGNKAKEKACNGVMFGGAKGIPAGKMRGPPVAHMLPF